MKYKVSIHYTDEIEADSYEEALDIAEDNALFWLSVDVMEDENE